MSSICSGYISTNGFRLQLAAIAERGDSECDKNQECSKDTSVDESVS